MSTTGCCVGSSVTLQPRISSAAATSARPLGRAALAFEHVRAHRVVDRREVPVQDLLGLVGRRVDPGTFAQLQRSLLRGRPVAAGADDEHARLVERLHRLTKRRLDGVRQPADVLAVERLQRGDGARVARCVAPRPLELRRADDNLVDELRKRRLGVAGHEPHISAERALGLHRQRRLALVRDAHHDVGRRRLQHRLERTDRPASRLRRMERRAAARCARRARPVAAPCASALGEASPAARTLPVSSLPA